MYFTNNRCPRQLLADAVLQDLLQLLPAALGPKRQFAAMQQDCSNGG
jgi:hypothetical protein